jgi:hypothetical protein
MLYYNIDLPSRRSASRRPMPTQLPHPHHHPGWGHPPAAISPSILRMSVVERLAVTGALVALLWAAVIWAMR